MKQWTESDEEFYILAHGGPVGMGWTYRDRAAWTDHAATVMRREMWAATAVVWWVGVFFGLFCGLWLSYWLL